MHIQTSRRLKNHGAGIVADLHATRQPDRRTQGATFQHQRRTRYTGRRHGIAQHAQPGATLLWRDPVETVGAYLGEIGKQLDQGDPGIGSVIVGPLRSDARQQVARLFNQAVIGAHIEIRKRQRHQHPPMTKLSSCRPAATSLSAGISTCSPHTTSPTLSVISIA